MAFEPKVSIPVDEELAFVRSGLKLQDFSDGKQPTIPVDSLSVGEGDNIPGLQPVWDRLQHVNQYIISSNKEKQDIERTLWMYIKSMARKCGALEKTSLKYYNAWGASETSCATLLSDLQNLAGEKFTLQQELEEGSKEDSNLSATLKQSNETLQEVLLQLQQQNSALVSEVQSLTDEKKALEQELKKALDGNNELSTTLTESKAALETMAEEYEPRLVHLTERLSQRQKKDAGSENPAATLSSSGSVSPLSLGPSEEVRPRLVKRPRRRVRTDL